MNYWTYLILILIITLIPQLWVQSTYKKYSKIKVSNGKTGAKLVEEMLINENIKDVSVRQIGGVLTDNYNSKNKTISLSQDNFTEASIASIAVAAHETGHAIQDNKGYFFLRARRALAPATIVASKISWIVIYLGFFIFYEPLMWMGILLLMFVLLFDVVTLPVEINASRRARRYLLDTGTYTYQEVKGVSSVLTAAAFTYIAATLAGFLQVIRLIGIVNDD